VREAVCVVVGFVLGTLLVHYLGRPVQFDLIIGDPGEEVRFGTPEGAVVSTVRLGCDCRSGSEENP